MSDELDFYIVDDIPQYIFYIVDDEEQEQYIPIKGEAGSFKYEKVAELPTTGEDGVLYLVPKSYTEQTASGNPISINVTEGAGKLTDLQLDGDTAQQTFSGKNLLSFNVNTPSSNANMTVTHGVSDVKIVAATTTGAQYSSIVFTGLDSTKTYTLSGIGRKIVKGTDGRPAIQVRWRGSNDGSTWTNWSNIYDDPTPTQGTSYPFSGSMTGYNRYNIAFYNNSQTPVTVGETTEYYDVMLELGSTATAYEPYVGGMPSPNPSYPQDINVVAGTQTISINGTNYPIDLGDIELAGIGTYQDYIYPSGTDWYIKKQIAKVTMAGAQSESWQINNTGTGNFYYMCRTIPHGDITENNSTTLMSNYGSAGAIGNTNTTTGIMLTYASTGDSYVRIRYGVEDTLTNWTTKLSTTPMIVYYPLATPTDIKITDTNLIAQLEAVRTAQLANGTNAISNTATGSNLAGDLELKYYEYNPTDKYTKWLWINADAAYEQM